MRADRCLCRHLVPMNTAVAPIRRSSVGANAKQDATKELKPESRTMLLD
jgi:hypothetical protein